MKNLTTFLFILLLGISGVTNAQGKFQWAKKIDCSQAAYDNFSGGIEKRGNYLYTTSMSGTNVPTNGFQFAKYDLLGNEVWWHSPQVDNSNYSFNPSFELLDADADSSGNMYAILRLSQADLTFAGNTLIPSLPSVNYLLKMSPTGQELWAKAFPSLTDEYYVDVTADGTCYVTGSYSNSLTVDTTTINGASDNTFIAKVSPLGTLEWMKHVYHTPSSGGILDGQENVYIKTQHLMSKYDSSGTQIFQNQYTIGSSMEIFDFDVDSVGNQQLLMFQSALNYSYGSMSSQINSGEALLLGKFDSSGNFVSISKIYDTLGLSDIQMVNLELDNQGRAYIYGRNWGFGPLSAALHIEGYKPRGFLILCTDLAGNELWLKNFSNFSSTYEQLTDIFVDDDMIYTISTAESWLQTVEFDSISFSSGNGRRLYIAGMENPNNYLSGTVFNDANGNGLQDFGESPIANEHVSLLGTGGIILTDSSGNYQFVTGNGPITIRMDSLDNSWFTTTPYNPAEYTIASMVGNQTIGGLDFGITNGTVSGTVYYDNNGNCSMDVGEHPMENVIILILPDSIYTSTNQNGYYTVGLDIGSYQIQNLTNIGSYQLQNCSTPPFTDSINVLNLGDQFNNRDFANSLIPGIYDLQVTATSVTAMRPGFDATINLTYKNVGSENITTGEIGFAYDSSLTYNSSTTLPDATFQDSLVWHFSNLSVGESRSLDVEYTVANNVNLLGATLNNTAYVYSIHSDQDSSNNVSYTNPIVTGAYDPNDKQVLPAGSGASGFVDPTTDLFTYTIRFQNTGNDTAINVVISDTLNHYLDPLSIDILAASDPYVFDISGSGTLQFTFPNIMLPDSNVNVLGSQGFIKFSVSLYPGLPIGTVIKNTAFIYFDFNPPIVTNTAVNTLQNGIGITEYMTTSLNARIYPNPTTSGFTVLLAESPTPKTIINVHNTMGQRVLSVPANGVITKLNTQGLQKGIYLVSSENNNERRLLGRVVIQ